MSDMKLRENETLVKTLSGDVKVRRSYLPAKHTYEFRFQISELFCPECGKQDVWIEDSPGDFYVGPEHRCGSCGNEFTMQ